MKKVSIVTVAIALAGLFLSTWVLRHHAPAHVTSNLRDKLGPALRAQHSLRSDQRLLSKFAQLPLSFEENRGQFNPHVKFATRGADYGLFLAGAHATIVHHGKVKVDDGDVSSAMGSLGRSEIQTLGVTDLTWIRANPKAEPQGASRQSGESNYFIGKDKRAWRRHVRHYARVQTPGLYPGIDLIYHGAQQRVEFDYVVAPHVNPGAIQVGISGPSIVALDAAGQLSISSSGDKLLLLPPVAYQEKDGKREKVEAHYELADSHQFGFRLGAYDESRPVIIDPVLEFAASFGPNANDTIVSDVALDSSGNIYVTGTTCETDYPTTSGVFQPSGGSNVSNFCNDAIVTKLDPAASTLIYSTYIGGQTGADFGTRLLIDSADNATVAGTTSSTDFPTTPGVYQSTAKGGTCEYGPFLTGQACSDAFLLKLSADGSSLQYSTLFGGERVEIALALAQDSTGDSYIAGATNSTALPLAGTPFSSTYGGNGDCQGGAAPCFDGFVAKFNSSGTQLMASTYLGGNDDDFAAALALDSSGNVYVVGAADSTNFPTTMGSIQPTHAGTTDQRDAFVSKLDPTLHTLQYSTFLGGAEDDIAFAVRVDSLGAAYITGSTLSPAFPVTAGAYQTAYKGANAGTTSCGSTLDSGILSQPTCGDVFVSKIDPSKSSGSQLVFSTLLGGSGDDFAYNLALDSQKNVWVTGNTSSTDFPYTSDAYFAPSNGGLFLSEIKNDGSALVFSTALSGGSGFQGLALGIDIDAAGDVFVAGQGTVSSTPGTYGVNQPGQVFIAKYAPGTTQSAVQLSATSLSFSAVTNGTSAPQSVTLTNPGSGPLHVAISLLTENFGIVLPKAFSESDNCSASIPPQGTCTISAIYLPNASATNTDGGTIQILDDAPGAPHQIQLVGASGLTTSTSFVPATLSFPGQQPAVASASQVSGLSADSAGASNIFAFTTATPVLSGPNASEFNVDESQCAVKTFGCLVTVTFTPAASATGTRTATLTVPTTAPNSPQTLQLTGTVATGPFAVLTSGSLIATTVGQTLNGDIFVKNTGGGTLNVTAFTVTGTNASEFVISQGSCGPALTLAPQASCFVNLAFTPTAPGNLTATITLADNEPTPASLAIVGTGTASGGPQIDATTFGTNAFSDTTVGQNTSFFPTFTASLTNFGTGANAAAHVTSVTLTGDFMVGPSPLGSPCAAGFVLAGNQGSCSVGVFFAPTAAGPRTGTLTIQTDAPGTPSFSYNLMGSGIQSAAVLLTPNVLNLGTIAVGGTTNAQPIVLKNTGNGTLNISGLTISGPFSQTTTCGATLAAGASCTFNVKFSPTVAGSGSGSIGFTANAAGSVFGVGLNGTGATGPTPLVVPASLIFGNQAIGSTSAPQMVTLSNAGDLAFSYLSVRASENFGATSNCPASIGPGVSCTITVTFAPTNDIFTGFQSGGAIFVTTKAPGSPLIIPAAGTATASTGATTLATIASSPNPSIVGQAVTFTATITSATPGIPTGSVTFLDNGNPLGPAVTLAAAKATFTTPSLAQGNHSIFCMYSGDANFAATTSSGILQTVNAGVTAATSTTVASSLNPVTLGQSVMFTATATSAAAGTLTGTLAFFDGVTQIGAPVTINAGSAAVSTTTLTQGIHSITASYSGDAKFSASTSPAITQTINATATAATTTTVVSSVNPATVGQNVMFMATSTSATAGTLTGTLTFFDGATQIGAPVTIIAGSSALSTTTLMQGIHSITAKYSGDTKFTASTSPAFTQTVNVGTKASTTTLAASSLSPSTTGANVTFTATVTSVTAGTITGTVTFLDGATSLGTGTLAGGAATFATSSLAAGTHSITAQYGGDANYAASTSAIVTQTVNANGDFSVSGTPNALTVVAGQTGTVSLTVTPQNGSMQTVTFGCIGLPTASACSFAPTSLTLDGTHAQMTQVIISTTARTAAAMAGNGRTPPAFGRLLGILALGLAGIFAMSLFGPRNLTRRVVLLLLALMIPVMALMSCSNAPRAPGGGGTPPGTYSVSVGVTAGTDSHSAPVALTVQ